MSRAGRAGPVPARETSRQARMPGGGFIEGACRARAAGTTRTCRDARLGARGWTG